MRGPTDHPSAGFPGRATLDDVDPFEPELVSLPDSQQVSSDVESELKTGTTTIGVTTEDAVVLVTDRRASAGRMVASKTVRKVEQIHPTGALTIAGSVSAAQSLLRTLKAESSLYEKRRGEDMSMTALSTLTGNLLRSGAFFIVQPVLGGIDEEGTHVFSIDPLGGTTEEDYTVSGSGSQYALGVLEQDYRTDLDVDDARSVSIRALESALERDTASGNGINIATITEDGVEIEEHETLDAVQ